MATTSKLVLDGSYGEGGGQVLRNAVAYATILNKHVEIINIRANRSTPGLRAQHVTGLQLCAELCGNGVLEGNEIGSTRIEYSIPSINEDTQLDRGMRRTLIGDTQTAGSICLLLQAALPGALFGSRVPTRLVLKGGTNAAFAPQYDYWEQVFWPTISKHMLGQHTTLVQPNLDLRGYYPKGGGHVSVDCNPFHETLSPINLTDRGSITRIHIQSHCAGKLPIVVAQEMAYAATETLKQAVQNVEISTNVFVDSQAVGSGCGILLVATTSTGCLLGGSALGKPKKPSKKVGQEAAMELIHAIQEGGCVDEWLQDQLILFMALAKGRSEILTGCLTLHTRTAIWVAEQVSGAKFEVINMCSDEQIDHADYARSREKMKGDNGCGKEGRIKGKFLIRCDGIGFVNTDRSYW